MVRRLLGGGRQPPQKQANNRDFWRLGETGFGQFDRDPQVDFRKHLVEAIVAGTVVEVGGDGFQPQHRRLIQGAAKEPDLEFIQRVERPATVFDRAAPALHGVFDALERDQGVDTTQGAQRHRGTICLRRIGLSERECAPWRPPRRGG